MRRAQRRSADAPGKPGAAVQRKKTFTSNLVQRRYAGKNAETAADPIATAQDGVAGAASPLPHLDTIQKSFGRHDVSGVKTANDDRAYEASALLGAQAYATGDRVAFAGTPTLHTAAHEAAHVVQQRAGVSLKGGVGESGDAYEQHADRVADLVVGGGSAEAALDEMAGSGGAGGGSGAVQRFDSPHHVEIGNSVEGESVTIKEVTFTPGELSALLDYVGPVTELQNYEKPALLEMKTLLAAGDESAAKWDALTNGSYSELSQKNEDHFAPGEGDSANFESSFIEYYSCALSEGARAKAAGEPMDTAYLYLYSAEHYLHDAFSAGHQVSQDQIIEAVDALIGPVNSKLILPLIGQDVWSRESETIQQYGWNLPGKKGPISQVEFVGLATAGGLWKGMDGMYATMRKYVHEALDVTGVEVSSPAHPDPWLIHGDHSLVEPGEGEEISIAAMQAAMSEFRAMVDINAAIPTTEPTAMATELFAQHRPVPTGDSQAAIDKIVTDATASTSAFVAAMVEAMCATITGVMDTVAGMVPGLVKLADGGDDGGDTVPFPDIPPEGGGDTIGGGDDEKHDWLGDYPSSYPGGDYTAQ